MAKGPGNNKEQMESLRQKLGVKGIEKAGDIVDTYTADEIALAFKKSRPSTNKALSKSTETLLSKLPDNEAKSIREKLAAVKV